MSLEIYLHMLVDIAVLTWMIAWSGGIQNPFFLRCFLLRSRCRFWPFRPGCLVDCRGQRGGVCHFGPGGA